MTSAPNPRLVALTDAGVSAWLDDLDRHRIESGDLARLVDELCIRGVTTNPTIFDKAISSGAAAYADQLAGLSAGGADVDAIIRVLTTDDVRAACDVFEPLWRSSNGVDGRVSIEVDPRLADDTDATIAQAKELWATVDRPNVLIKVPATPAGLPAITAVIGSGISVNVTLIFSVERYREVVDAYSAGLELADANEHDLSTIHSVASFFVSRIDTEVDNRLRTVGGPAAEALLGKAAVANARLAWAAHQQGLAGDRWRALAARGATVQRPLWASTGVKDPAYSPTMYVVDLVARGCVNTMPEATLDAVAAGGPVPADSISGTEAASAAVWESIAALGIDAADVFATLEHEGVTKFIDSWEQLRATVGAAAKGA
ncbi:MAG: transaldolase [Actinomycetota bacterium]|nr:transaldolase [Actinomycetota bacterium]